MKKTLLLFVLLVISTTSYAGEAGGYRTWGSLSDGGMKSKVPYPKDFGFHARTHKVNPSSYGKYLGFSIWIKTTNVNNYVALYIRLNNKAEKLIKFKYSKNIKGTKSWKRYYTPHIYVPLHTESVGVGVKLKGAGKVEYYDDQLKEYSYK